MAHHADIIPWHNLASLLEPEFHDFDCQAACSLLSPIDVPESKRDAKLAKFGTGFINALRDSVKHERAKFPVKYDVCDDEVVLTDEIVTKIYPTVKRWHRLHYDASWGKQYSDQILCTHVDEDCKCLIPLGRRTMRAFTKQYQSNGCFRFYETNEDSFFQLELIKTLLVHNDLETVLKICSNPSVNLIDWESVAHCQCEDWTVGWDQLYERALDNYMCLNILYCFPDLHDVEPTDKSHHEYRSLEMYQDLLFSSTALEYESDIAKYPHRAFYGFADGQMKHGARQELSLGTALQSQLDTNTEPRIILPPSTEAISSIRTALRSKGLPSELVQFVLEFAGYVGDGSSGMVVPHHPLHPANREQLMHYLAECWRLVIHCAVMGEVQEEVTGVPGPQWDEKLINFYMRYLDNSGSCEWAVYPE